MKNSMFLLVDTNSFALRELSEMLEYFGYSNVQQTQSTKKAWGKMRSRNYDCVICAWDMPEMNGLGLLRKARDNDTLFHTPFFLTDSSFTKLKVVQAGQSGITGLVVTPVNMNNFKAKMMSLAKYSIKPEPTEDEKTLDTAMELVENKDYSEALTVFEDLVEKGESAEYYYNIGYTKTVQGKYAEAIEAFQKATQIDRLYAKAFKAMGNAYKKLGKEDEAEKCLSKAADIYISKENDKDAEEVLNEILEINPDTINVYNSLGVLYRRRGDPKTALKQYEKALKIHPDEPFILYNMGRLHLDMKDTECAKKYFTEALKIHPEFDEAQEVLNAIELGTI